jgi:hypothetical protein
MKDEEFYQEANEMHEGWGDYLKKIDDLKTRVENKQTVTLNEACWLMYADLYLPASKYLKFKKKMQEKNVDNLTWEQWQQKLQKVFEKNS